MARDAVTVAANLLRSGEHVKVKIATHAACRLKACQCEYHPRGAGIFGRWAYYLHTRTGYVTGPDEDIPTWTVVKLTRPYPDAKEIGLDADGWPMFETSRTYYDEVALEPDEAVELLLR